jgi:hypothetical protein
VQRPSPDDLWSPEAHEEPAGAAWDDARARQTVAAICCDAEAAFDAERLWPAHPLDGEVEPGELKTLYLGAAGMVWALDRLARAGVHAPARDWAEVAVALAADTESLPPSLLVGSTGILLVSWLLEPSAETADRLAAAITANVGNETNELLWGSPGTMLATSVLLDGTGDDRFAELWRRSALQLLGVRDPDGCWTQLLYGTTSRYFGAGHGFAGNAHALLMRPELLDDPDGEAAAMTRVVLEHAIDIDGNANWPPHADGPLEVQPGAIRVQWCHGSPGIVTAFAGAQPGNTDLTRILVACGELIWRAGPLRKGAGLCHGTAGNGFALLALFHRTGDEIWLERARTLAMHAAGQVQQARARHGGGRYTLWTGDIGAAMLLERCLEGTERGFPTLDAW